MSAVGVSVLSLDGALTMRTVAALAARGHEALAAGDVVVDLSAVSAADSAALALLLDWVRVARARGRMLEVRALPPGLRSLAGLYGVDELLPLAA